MCPYLTLRRTQPRPRSQLPRLFLPHIPPLASFPQCLISQEPPVLIRHNLNQSTKLHCLSIPPDFHLPLTRYESLIQYTDGEVFRARDDQPGLPAAAVERAFLAYDDCEVRRCQHTVRGSGLLWTREIMSEVGAGRRSVAVSLT
jgi:hypothetical protein